MEIRKAINKMTEHTHDIIFGILSGCGLMFLTSAIIISIMIIIPALQFYITILYIILYLTLLIPTSIYYTRGWFRIIYLTSALILLLAFIYAKLSGAVI